MSTSTPTPPDRSSSAPPVEPPPVRIVDAEEVQVPVAQEIVPATIRRPLWYPLTSTAEWLFGVASLIVGLAVLATIPVLQMLSLGYLLESGGRVARSGKLRDGFVGVRKAARVGGLILGTWLVLLPIRFISRVWYAAYLIEPESTQTQTLRVLLVVTTVVAVAHIVWAWARGGRLRHFLWPAPIRLIKRLVRPGKYVEARDAVWDFVTGLRLPYYFWLGLRGFITALAWLFVPICLFIGATTLPTVPAVLSGVAGAVSFGLIIIHLPFLQAHFAASGKSKAMLEVGEIYRVFFRSPLACCLALLVCLLFALPLYLLKIELTPREVALLPSLVFVVFIFPARLLAGWAVGRSRQKTSPKRPLWQLSLCAMSLMTAVPAVGFYVLVVFFTRYTSWHGVWSLFEQHAFLVPVPFLGM